jgi:hypothetical protein
VEKVLQTRMPRAINKNQKPAKMHEPPSGAVLDSKKASRRQEAFQQILKWVFEHKAVPEIHPTWHQVHGEGACWFGSLAERPTR